MKHVFNSHSELCHQFANNWRELGHGKANNMLFDGNSIYSYGMHWEIGRFITNDIIIINDLSYSISTSKHVSHLINACTHKQLFYLSHICPDKVKDRIKFNLKKLTKARKPELYIDAIKNIWSAYDQWLQVAQKIRRQKNKGFKNLYNINMMQGSHLIDIYNKLAKFKRAFGTNGKYKFDVYFQKIGYDLEAIEKKRREFEAKKAEEEKRQFDEALKKFRNHEQTCLYGTEFTYLRGSECGEYIETSKGMRKPVAECFEYWLWLNTKARKNENLTEQKIFGFAIRQLTDDIIEIGCHKMQISEIAMLFDRNPNNI
jgi:hypothetical protein